MFLQVESIGQKAAKHETNLFFARAIRHARRDIVFVVIEPRRPDNLIELALPRVSSKTFQRDVPARELPRHLGDLVVVVRADFALTWPD